MLQVIALSGPAGIQASPFARDFATMVRTYYTGVYRPGRIQAIQMAHAQYPRGQKLYMVELEQIAQILGVPEGETVQNWSNLLQQYLRGAIVSLPTCRAMETVNPVSRVCMAPATILPTPRPTPTPTPAEAGAIGGNLILLGGAAVVLLFLLRR